MDDDTQTLIDHETQTQIQELALLLNRTKNQDVGVRGENKNSVCEADWAASHFLAKLLMQAQVTNTFPNHTNTEIFLQANGFEITQLHSLEKKFWIRFILGELHIPRSIKSALYVIKQDARNDSEKRNIDEYLKSLGQDKKILEALARFSENRNHFWISRAEARKIREAHRYAHPKSPTLKELIKLGVIQDCKNDGNDGFVLVLHNPEIDSAKNLWQVLHNHVSALLWEWLCDDNRYADDTQRVLRWLEQISGIDKIYGVEATISAKKQERLKSAMQIVLFTEPDILGREAELEKMRWESDYGFGNLHLNPLSSKQQSLLDLWYWWSPLSEITWRLGFGRKRFDSLMHIALGHSEWYSHNDFLQNCLENSEDKPYLFHWAIRRYENAHRAGIARLLQNPQTASLGLKLLHHIHLNNDLTFTGDRVPNAIRLRDQRTDLWKRGVYIVCRVANVLTWQVEDWLQKENFRNTIIALGEILLFSARDTSNIKNENEEILEGSRDRFMALKTSFERSNLFRKYALPVYKWILKSLEESVSADKTSNSMPMAEMKVFFWLLENMEEGSVEEIEIAQGITTLYTREIKRWRVGNQTVSWHDSLPEMTEFAWAKVARVLMSINVVDSLIQPLEVDFVFELKSVQQNIQRLPNDSTNSAYSLTRTWLQKIRTHILVLLRIHNKLQANDAGLSTKIETKIRDLVSGAANPNSFTSQLGLFNHEVDNSFSHRSRKNPFTEAVIKGLNQFSAKGYRRTYEAWIEKEENPDVLLAIVEGAVSEDIRKAALEGLSQHDLNDYLETQLFITGYERLINNAILAGESNVVRRVLEYMDAATLNEKQRTNWQILSFRIKLMLAYQEKDSATINTLEAPSFEGYFNNQSPEEARRDFENTRIFYRALLDLELNPKDSYQGFSALFEQEPTSSTYGANRFAAAVHSAQAIVEPEIRKQSFLDALDEWESVRSSFSEDDLKRVMPNACYSRLIVFDEIELDVKFDAEWENLTGDLKVSVPYIDIAVKNALRRNKNDDAEKIFANAKPYHLDSFGNLSIDFADVQKRFDGLSKEVEILVTKITTESSQTEPLRNTWLKIIQLPLKEYVRVVGRDEMQPHEILIQTLLIVLKEFLSRIKLYQKASFTEDELSAFILSLLRMYFRLPASLTSRFDVRDQTQGGSSGTGKGIGERDGVICFDSTEIAIFEALRLESVVKEKIKDHVQKAVINYNPVGLSSIYVLIYFQGREWSEFWERYKEFIVTGILFDEYTLDKDYYDEMTQHEPEFSQGLAWKCFGYKPKTLGERLIVYHIAVNLGQ